MKIDLSGKRAVVTGSTGGIGFAIASGLAACGAEVVINGRDAAATDGAAGRIRASVEGAKVVPVAGDLGTPEGADRFADQAGDADVLVNNLGLYEMKPFAETPDGDWMRLFEINVMSGVRLARRSLPKMLERDWGRIIFLSSESALNPIPNTIPYSVTKAAQLAVSRGLAEMTAGTGVTVNAVLPGPTRSRALDGIVRSRAAAEGVSEAEIEKGFMAMSRPNSLLRRLARTEEVANMVVYVASPLSSATNGAALRVDGGTVRAIA